MKKKKIPRASSLDHLPDITETASSTDCTGLMPTVPSSADEAASYAQLFSTEATGAGIPSPDIAGFSQMFSTEQPRATDDDDSK